MINKIILKSNIDTSTHMQIVQNGNIVVITFIDKAAPIGAYPKEIFVDKNTQFEVTPDTSIS
jgi:hypothetical protein